MESLIQYAERHPALTFMYAILAVMLVSGVVGDIASIFGKGRKCDCGRRGDD